MGLKVLRPSLWYWACRSSREGGGSNEASAEAAQPSRRRAGVVVVLGWMLSKRKHLHSYVRLYESCGWESLVCHPQVFNLFFPSKATTLAVSVLDELVKDLENHPAPVVFAVFSGGHKACLYKIIQILLGKCNEVNVDVERFGVVKRLLAGLMFDSSPVDFVSHLGAKFVSHQVLTLKPGRPISLVSWGAHAVGKGMDAVFHRQLEPQRIDLWENLYSTVDIGPILFLCSENDQLAPVETIRLFASNLRKLGGNVSFVEWKESEHVGHFRLYPEQYAAAVKRFLAEVTSMNIVQLEKYAKGEAALKNTMQPEKHAEGSYFCRQSTSSEGARRLRGQGWTDLPEHVLTEIRRLCRLPHIQPKGQGPGLTEKIEPLSHTYQGIEIHTCSRPMATLSGNLGESRWRIPSKL